MREGEKEGREDQEMGEDKEREREDGLFYFDFCLIFFLKIEIGMDVAASEFWNAEKQRYDLGTPLTQSHISLRLVFRDFLFSQFRSLDFKTPDNDGSQLLTAQELANVYKVHSCFLSSPLSLLSSFNIC